MSVYRNKPPRQPDATQDGNQGRNTGYGDRYVVPVAGGSNYAQADEGSYVTFCTATPGTGQVGNVATSLVATTPDLLLVNTSTSGQRFYLDFIRLTLSVVEASSTRVQFTHYIDNINRYSSGGAALTVNNVNTDIDGNPTGSILGYVGAITATAANSARLLGHNIAKGANVGVVWDIYEFRFGQSVPTVSAGAAIGASQITVSFAMPPVVLGSNGSYLLYDWAASMGTAPTFIVEGGGWFR